MGERGPEGWLEARAAWPGVNVGEAEFTAYVEERRDSSKVGGEHAAVRSSDLYLACACARGDAAGLLVFERAFFGDIERSLKRRGGAGLPPRDEVEQLVRHRLFVADEGARPRIAEYSGRGDLRSWFRVIVSRMVLNLAMRPGPEIPFENDLLVRMLGGTEKLELGRSSYEEHFRAAFADNFARLGDRERALLRYAFGEELTVAAIGALYGVHKTTAARWVVQAHQALLDGLKATLMSELGISSDEYASVLRAVHSRLELSLERHLRAPA
jgi:RNA polymerase sigma-70 factor (ECF subfamily)